MTERTISKADMDAAIAAAEAKYGDKLPKGLLRQMAEVESAYGTKLSNPSGARGPWQFMPKTGPAYGLATEEDRMDPYKSADAAARLLLDNKRDLEKRIGRPVSNGELYLAHQQGAAGAAKLLKDPNRNAAEVVGAERVRQNLPKSRQGEHTKLTTGDFAKLWTSKFDGGAGAPPAKKPDPRATGSLGVLPGGGSSPISTLQTPTDFLTYNPNSLGEMNRLVAPGGPSPFDELPDAPVAKGSLGSNLGQLGSVATTPTGAPAEQEAPVSRKSTAILAGLNTVDKVLRTQRAIDSNVENSTSEYEYAPSGLGGEFSAGIDAGMAGINRDREYFGLILDTLTGNKEGVWSHEKNAEMAEAAAAFAASGMPSFEEFMKAPTLDGFITQAASITGQVAPSALESIAAALVGGGGAMLAKAGLSVASKAVVKELVTDILKKKVAKEALDQNEDGILKVLWGAGKKGGMAGAFGQEFVSGSAGSIGEFKEVDKDINMEEALGALAMGVPQALVGAGSEIFLVKAFGEAALKKSSRMAGDNVFKRFASDMGALMGKSALSEGASETVQEGLFIAQRKAIDPAYDDEEAQLRLAQAAFSGIVGGGLFAGGAAAPTSVISALNRKTETDPNAPAPAAGTTDGTPPPGGGTPPKMNIGDRLKGVMKKATSYIEDASEARVQAEAKKATEGVDDSVLTGNTAAEGTVVLAEQFKEMMDPASPRKHVWIAENDFETTLDTYQQERLKRDGYFVEEQTDPDNKGRKLEYTFVPGKGVMVGEVKQGDTAPPGAVLRNLVKSKAPEERLNKLIGAMLGMADTGGVKGDTVVRAVDPKGVPLAEQTTTTEGVPAATAAVKAQVVNRPDAKVEVVPVKQSLEERKALVDSEQTADDFFKRIAEEASAAPAKETAPAPKAKPAPPVVTAEEKKLLNDTLKTGAPNTETPAAKDGPLDRVYDADGNEFLTTPELNRVNDDGTVEVQLERFGKIDSWLSGPKEDLGSDNPSAPDAVLSTGEKVADLKTADLTVRSAALRTKSRERSDTQNTDRRDFTRVRSELDRRGVKVAPVNRGDATPIKISEPQQKRARKLLKVLEPHVQFRSIFGDVYERVLMLFSADQVFAKDLDDAILDLELSLAWPRSKPPGTNVITAMRDLAQMRMELSPSIIERDAATTQAKSLDKLKETAAKLSKPEKRAVWELLKRLAKVNQGVSPAIVESSSKNPDALGSFNSLSNFLGFKPAGDPTGTAIPTALVIMHELGHWAYYNTLSPADRVEFWSIMENYETEHGINEDKLSRGLTGPRYQGPKSNARTSPQEFFAQQFSYWSAQKMGLTKEAVVDSPSEEYGGKTYRKQLEEFFSRVAKHLIRVVEEFFDKNKVDPEMAALFDRVFGAEQVSPAKPDILAAKPPAEAKPPAAAKPPAEAKPAAKPAKELTNEQKNLLTDITNKLLDVYDKPNDTMQTVRVGENGIVLTINTELNSLDVHDIIGRDQLFLEAAFRSIVAVADRQFMSHVRVIGGVGFGPKTMAKLGYRETRPIGEKGKITGDVVYVRDLPKKGKSEQNMIIGDEADPDLVNVNEDGDTTEDAEESSELDMKAAEDELNALYAEIDNEHSVVVATYPKQRHDRSDKGDKDYYTQFTAMLESLPYNLEYMIDHFLDYEDIMSKTMLNKLVSEMEFNPESVFSIRENEEGNLELLKRDDSTDKETIAIRRAIKETLQNVFKFSGDTRKNGVWFYNNKMDSLVRGTHQRIKAGGGKISKTVEGRQYETVTGSASKFYLRKLPVAAKEGELSVSEKATQGKTPTKMYNLSGRPPTKKNPGLGSQGIKYIADAGRALNAEINRAPTGRGLTAVQSVRLGLETMIAELLINGFELVYEASPDTVPVRVEDFTNLTGDAAYEVVAVINNKPYTMAMLFGGKMPFEASESVQPEQKIKVRRGMRPLTPAQDAARREKGKHVVQGPNQLDRDPNDYSEQLSDATETVASAVTSREELSRTTEQVTDEKTGQIRTVERVEQGDARRIGQGETKQTAPDPEMAQALQKGLQKRRGGFEEERKLNKAQNKANRERINVIVDEAIEADDLASVESKLNDIPDDVFMKIGQIPGKGNYPGTYVVTVSSNRFEPRDVKSKSLEIAVARAHAMANAQPMEALNRYDVVALQDQNHSTLDRQMDSRGIPKIPEIGGVPAPKNQTSVIDEKSTAQNLNDVTVMGKLGSMTTRVLGMATTRFLFRNPVVVVTLDHLKSNFDALVASNGAMAGHMNQLAKAIASMEIASDDSPYGSVVMGNKNIIILRDTPETEYDQKTGREVYNPDDALMATVLGHEVGHIIFKQEYENIFNGPDSLELWPAFVRFRKEMQTVPESYVTSEAKVNAEVKKRQAAGDKDANFDDVGDELKELAFEEWFADQVMAFVYNQAKPAKNGRDGRFKQLAKAFANFWADLNTFLGGRMKMAKRMGVNPDTGKKQIVWSFPEFMEKVIERHSDLRQSQRTPSVEAEITIRNMTLNIAGRLPVNAARNVANSARSLLSTGSFGKVAYKLHNILQASVDYMGLSVHGRGGQILKNFFGTLSQKVVTPGWNKNKIFAENRFNTELARILGITRKSGAEDWKSQRVTDILNEAADNSIPTAQLTSQEAKDVREFFKKIMDEYITDPATGIQWVDVGNLPNFGGSRMYDIEKIAANLDGFVDWVIAQPQWSGTRDMAMAMAKRIISHTGDPVANLTAEVEHDITTGAIPNTPVGRAAEMLHRSMNGNAVTPVLNSVIKDAKAGAYTFSDLLTTLRVKYPTAASNPNDASLAFLHRINAAASDAQLESDIREFWRQRTERMRLSPGMDPALSRTGLDRIGTKAFREAIPGDVDGWLIPQAKANSQYLHYVTRKVEYNKMGGYETVSEALNLVPREHRQQVDDAVMANLGKFGENIGPKWRTFNSVAAVWTVYTTLLFAALTSVTDLSGIAVRAKEFGNMSNWFSAMKEAMTNEEWKTFAEDIGVVTMRSQDHAMIGHGELDYANNTSRALMNGFFRVTGLEFFTRFSRTMAVGMGRQFIVRTAERTDFDAVKHGRWLAELGLTREDVQAWTASGNDMSTPIGRKMRDGIARFADEAVIRPDASQRPTWASSPYFQVIWQLKSYYYGFGKTILGGMGREIKNRYDETGSISEAAGPALLMAATIIPLTMLGLSSREWLKWLFQTVVPGVENTPSMTSKMDGGEYAWEIFKRSGVLGPFSLGLTTMEAFKWEGIAAPFTANVPMFDLFDDTLFDGDWTRPLPVINNIK